MVRSRPGGSCSARLHTVGGSRGRPAVMAQDMLRRRQRLSGGIQLQQLRFHGDDHVPEDAPE